jgi:hypothetical protein
MSMAHDDNSSIKFLASFRFEAFSKPAIDGSKKIARLIPLTLVAPEPLHAHRGAQFPGFCLLLASDRKRAIKIRFCFFWIRRERFECDFPGNAINLSGPRCRGTFCNPCIRR